jgi:anti-sigma factor RsiW
MLVDRQVVSTTMLSPSHRRFRFEVHRLVDGELSPTRVDALSAHLQECPRCRGDLGWWLAIRGALLRLG